MENLEARIERLHASLPQAIAHRRDKCDVCWLQAQLAALTAENEKFRQALKRDHSSSCSILHGADCNCGWNDGEYNADDELAALTAENSRLREALERARGLLEVGVEIVNTAYAEYLDDSKVGIWLAAVREARGE